MYVCICNAVTDQDIRDAYDDGARTMRALQTETGVATCCGRCGPAALEILSCCRAEEQQAPGVPFTPVGRPAMAV